MENNLESRPSYIICGTFFHFAPVQNKDVGSLFKKKKNRKKCPIKSAKI